MEVPKRIQNGSFIKQKFQDKNHFLVQIQYYSMNTKFKRCLQQKFKSTGFYTVVIRYEIFDIAESLLVLIPKLLKFPTSASGTTKEYLRLA